MSNTHDNYVNPFDDEQYAFLVLKNSQQQYSVWPSFAAQPKGWVVSFGPAQRAECIAYIESNWTRINPFKPQ